jgi:hypothetical protein
MSEQNCARVRDLAAELALGVLPGDERAEVLEHMVGCVECRELVRGLTAVGDDLIGLTPGVEPPVGFEDRVLARIVPHRRRRRSRRWLPVSIAAALAAIVFGVSGWLIGTSGGGGEGTELASANLVDASSHTVGQVYSYSGRPSWVYMMIAADRRTGPVRCELERRSGAPVVIGTFPLANGYGDWGVPDPVDPTTVVGARLVMADGTVLATARF